jgi:hypothetical protein
MSAISYTVTSTLTWSGPKSARPTSLTPHSIGNQPHLSLSPDSLLQCFRNTEVWIHKYWQIPYFCVLILGTKIREPSLKSLTHFEKMKIVNSSTILVSWDEERVQVSVLYDECHTQPLTINHLLLAKPPTKYWAEYKVICYPRSTCYCGHQIANLGWIILQEILVIKLECAIVMAVI